MNNLKEMDRFLEEYRLQRLNQKEIQNMDRPNTSNEMETVIKNLPTKKIQGLDGFTNEFSQALREKLTFILHKRFQKLQREEHF